MDPFSCLSHPLREPWETSRSAVLGTCQPSCKDRAALRRQASPPPCEECATVIFTACAKQVVTHDVLRSLLLLLLAASFPFNDIKRGRVTLKTRSVDARGSALRIELQFVFVNWSHFRGCTPCLLKVGKAWIGFGGSFTESAAMTLHRMSKVVLAQHNKKDEQIALHSRVCPNWFRIKQCDARYFRSKHINKTQQFSNFTLASLTTQILLLLACTFEEQHATGVWVSRELSGELCISEATARSNETCTVS
eukprot:4972670-Amphidinium_carterae.1